MKRLGLRARRSARAQRGFTIILLVSFLVLVSAYLIANSLGRTGAEVAIERNQRTMQALQEAKAALIVHAASQAWTTGTNDQPGSLPCPDTNNDGTADSCGSSTANRIGRLPWKTLRTSDLRDASGERLWYAVSANFRTASGTTVINSDTQGTLAIYDDQQSTAMPVITDVVAVVFAPGPALGGQDRTLNGAAQFLEGRNAAGTDDFTMTPQPPGSYPGTFNDKLTPLTRAELLAVVEPAVAARIERDIKPFIATSFTQWNAFPFPATFASPNPGTNGSGSTRPQSNYVGSTSTTRGLLPVTASVSYPWTSGSGSVSLIGGSGDIKSWSCSTDPLPGWRCTIQVDDYSNPRFRVQGRIGANAGISFPKLPNASEIVSNRTLSSRTITGTLTSAGVGTVIFEGTWASSGSSERTVNITIPDVLVSPLTSASDATAGWFISNEWYRQTYYAVSPGYTPGSSATCNPLPASPSCLTVNNLPPSYAQADDKRAILVLAGRALNGASRPSANLGDYLEGENATPGDFKFEHRSGAPTSTNDRVVVVAP
jgi:hypothetical protein